jgi:hypothetical protein
MFGYQKSLRRLYLTGKRKIAGIGMHYGLGLFAPALEESGEV